jgi:hypothetical protein
MIILRFSKNNFTLIKIFSLLIFLGGINTSCDTNIFGPNEGTVMGTIKDIHNNPVKGATVKITYFEINKDGNQTEKSITRASDSAGFYIAEVPLAEIGILITKNGYEEVLFYDYLEQDQAIRSFPTVTLNGNTSGSDLRVINHPFRIQENDTMYFSLNITDEYKFKKQEPYWVTLKLSYNTELLVLRSFELEVPYFNGSFKAVSNKVKVPVISNRDTLTPGNYKLNALIYDSDGLESDIISTQFKIE